MNSVGSYIHMHLRYGNILGLDHVPQIMSYHATYLVLGHYYPKSLC